MIAQANSFKMPLADNSVHCAITSVPYWGLRDYGLKPLAFGGRSDCQHEWGEESRGGQQIRNGKGASSLTGGITEGMHYQDLSTGQFCRHCQAWLGSYGLEPTIGLFVQHTVEVCREIKRVLRPDGVFWLNIGDSFATGKNGRSAADGKALGSDDRTFRDKPFSITEVPAKNLCLIPQRVVIALQEDGWIVRSAPVWVKRNPMPESVGDRPGTAHEYIYMLVKSAKYWWDGEAVRKPHSRLWDTNNGGSISTGRFDNAHLGENNRSSRHYPLPNPSGRALRTSDFFFDSLDAAIAHLTAIRDAGGLLLDNDGGPGAFVVNPKGFAGAHYATFPLALVEPMIKASAPDKCCPKCGRGWVRVTEPTPEYAKNLGKGYNDHSRDLSAGFIKDDSRGRRISANYQTLGFHTGCACYRTRNETKRRRQDMRQRQYNLAMEVADDTTIPLLHRGPAIERAAEMRPYLWSTRVAQNQTAPTVPGVVLDPFAGSGTVGQACRELGRRFVGLDLSLKYLIENALARSERKTSAAVLATLPLFADMEF